MKRLCFGGCFGLQVAILLVLLSPLQAQEAPYGTPEAPPDQSQTPSLSSGQLSDLTAPIALYPDPLLSQILVASTYPQELSDAEQWVQQNGGLAPWQLVNGAKQQNWDPSVQVLAGFPNVLALLTRNMQWTAALGQAFMAQPTDVMNSIQYLRAQARANGRLANTPELSVNTQFQNGQSAIQIEPVNPQMMYVPAYNPYAVWGPPAAGSYPDLPYQGTDFGSLFSAAVNLASMFSGFTGVLGPTGWGWTLSWLAQTLFVNNSFFSNFGFRLVSGLSGLVPWTHNSGFGYGAGGYARGGMGAGWRGSTGGRFSTASSLAGRSPLGAFNQRGRGGDFRAPTSAQPNASGARWRNFDNRPASNAAGRFGQQSWARNREPYNRFSPSAYAGRPANYRAPANDWRSQPARERGISNFNNNRSRWGSRPSSGFSESRSGHGFRPWHSSASWKAPKAPKQEHFKAPHFKQPHFSAPHFKSHGGGHFSKGHGGGKHHR